MLKYNYLNKALKFNNNSTKLLLVRNNISSSNNKFYSTSKNEKIDNQQHHDNSVSVKSSLYLNYDTGKERGGYVKKSLYDYDPIASNAIKESTEYFAFGDTPVGDIVKAKKDREIFYVKANSTIFDAIKVMDQHGIGALLVVSDVDGSLVGIFTERDYLGRVALLDKDSKKTLVQDAMTKKLITIDSKTGVVEAMRLMTNKRFRHIPVTDFEGKNVIGMVSITDLIKTLRSNQKETIKYLNNFLNDPGRYSI